MGRSPIRRVNAPRRRRALDWAVLAGVGIVLLFAIVGVVSAGSFVGGKLSAGSATPAGRLATPAGRSTSVAEVARAHAQATAIVRAAQSTGKNLLATATSKARRRARTIRRSGSRSAITLPTATAASLGSGPTVAPAPATPTPPPVAGVGSTAITPSARPNLSGVPASWLVVAYGATFGNGPGSAGTITVTNRGNKAFSGVARVIYTRGGSAVADFTDLAPGQTVVLALNGTHYTGGGYRIVVPKPR